MANRSSPSLDILTLVMTLAWSLENSREGKDESWPPREEAKPSTGDVVPVGFQGGSDAQGNVWI